ncbi:MAG: glycosyltransferase family 2 protein [Deltaproteobacteria bacterium]|nr:glycosyltransferase family 2 protein [Deltaproteobacteria bacterium]
MNEFIALTVIVPSYNDAQGLRSVLPPLIASCKARGWRIIVVDDGSTDGTSEVLGQFSGEIRVIKNETNLGYGASIKRGIVAADTEWVATFDADGQHRVEDLEKLAAEAGCCDAVIGKRENSSHCSLMRMPGKWILGKVANILVGRRIPDINCGLRIFRRKAILGILRLTSDSFSFSTSSLIALMKLGYNVNLVPVTTQHRVGNSTVHQMKDGFNTILLILRLITLFDPLRIMLPFSAFFFVVGVIYQITSFVLLGFSLNKLTLLLWIFSITIFLVALIADQISALRREMAIYPLNQKQERDANYL